MAPSAGPDAAADVADRPPTPPDADRGALLRRFATDPRELRVFARVRMASAVVAALGASALLLGDLPVPVFLVALLALFVCAAWIRQGRRALVAARRARPELLAIHVHGFALDEGALTSWVPWHDVEAVELDEERLDIVVRRRVGPPLRLEPRYPGVDIHELVRTLSEARQAAPRSTGAPPA